ncbi:MAG: di-trans,poly-cis-decaprenylcistransferase [Candidatus Aminicenantes bacterium RBG_16_63_16]|nr:MAG: di-trans,poly-cis-decaprenylcistransferase [Candidatus Aminicenantes bacterium RBG_16_63_16]
MVPIDLEGFVAPGSEEEALLRQLDLSALPRHVAVIMDGNGRWAERRRLARIEGHRAASKAVEDSVETCARLGVEYLTLFAFSKENWKRPKREVSLLWKLLEEYLRKEDKELIKNKFRLKVIGQREAIPESIEQELRRVEGLTRGFDRLTIVLALNYSGRAEIVDAVKKILDEGGVGPRELDEAAFSRYLYTAAMPDPDLLIRTSGEQRISNFLLWQIAYSELWITPVLWPDFRRKHFLEALVDFQKRERRFGAVHAQPPENS